MKKIKISFTKKTPKGIVTFEFVKGNVTRLVEKDGKEILQIGVGNAKKVNLRKLRLLVRKVIRTAKAQKITRLARDRSFYEFAACNRISNEDIASLFMENAEMANFEFTKHKTKPKDGFDFVEEIVFVGTVSGETKRGLKNGQTIGEYVNLCRTIANTPGGDMTPQLLVNEAKNAAKGLNVKVSALTEKKLEEIKAGGILGVGKGSKFPPRLIVMEYWGAGKKPSGKKVGSKRSKSKRSNSDQYSPVVLVGKGITFDTGGLSLKPSGSMLGMHMDMSGGAAVIATIALAAKLKIKKNVVAIVPAVENMIGGESYRPGDILRSMSGKTIEVLNTDAEGRVVLADALHYAKKYNPKLCVDVATLTGAAVVALGERANAFMTRDEKFHTLFREIGEESGDYMWPLPLWDEYFEDIKGTHGDIANTNNSSMSGGGTITAGMFLAQFTKNMPWVHVDMAPRMTAIAGDELAKGAAGEPVRFLTKLLKTY